MPIRDMTDQEVAEAVLKRLRDSGLRSLRAMEGRAPVSRTTLAAWLAGRYTMKDPTRAACLRWLGEVVSQPGEPLTEADKMFIAADWMERLAGDLRRRAMGSAGVSPVEEVRERMDAEGTKDCDGEPPARTA